MKEIEGIKDIKVFVDIFYHKVLNNNELSLIFKPIVEDNLDHHLQTMYKFWDSLIFGSQDYKGSPFAKHINLGATEKHFDEWIKLFHETIDENFEGPIAQNTKQRAVSIAYIFQSKLKHLGKMP